MFSVITSRCYYKSYRVDLLVASYMHSWTRATG